MDLFCIAGFISNQCQVVYFIIISDLFPFDLNNFVILLKIVIFDLIMFILKVLSTVTYCRI